MLLLSGLSQRVFNVEAKKSLIVVVNLSTNFAAATRVRAGYTNLFFPNRRPRTGRPFSRKRSCQLVVLEFA